MLSESILQSFETLQLFEVVTICDNFHLFILIELKHEICWKTFNISANCLVQYFYRYSLEFGNIRINNDFFTPYQQNSLLNRYDLYSLYTKIFCNLC